MNPIKPIKPTEVLKRKQNAIPNEIIQAVNDCIVKNWSGKYATFKENEVVERYFEIIGEANIQSNREKIFDYRYLDFESIFENEGWIVEYDKPAYNETYDANYTFTPRKK